MGHLAGADARPLTLQNTFFSIPLVVTPWLGVSCLAPGVSIITAYPRR